MSDNQVETKRVERPIQDSTAPAQQELQGKKFEKNTSKVRSSRRENRRDGQKQDRDPFETKIISIRRVSKMFYGGRRMNLSVVVVVGDKKGKVGIGIGKGADVRSAQEKATSMAKKNMVMIQLKGNTIPHDIAYKFKSSRILLKPAAPGTGIIAGSSMRIVAEVAGINDMLGKILGTNNKITNAYATLNALAQLRNTRL